MYDYRKGQRSNSRTSTLVERVNEGFNKVTFGYKFGWLKFSILLVEIDLSKYGI